MSLIHLLEGFVRPNHDSLGNRQAELSGGRKVKDQLEFHRLLDRNVGRLGALENSVNQRRGAPAEIADARSVGHEATSRSEERRVGEEGRCGEWTRRYR